MTRTIQFVLISQICPFTIWFIQLKIAIQVAIGFLCLLQQPNPLIELLFNLDVSPNSQGIGSRLKHFVNIRIIKNVADISTFFSAASPLKILFVLVKNKLLKLLRQSVCKQRVLSWFPKLVLHLDTLPRNRLKCLCHGLKC